MSTRLPASMQWLFPDVDAGRLEAERDFELVLPRVLERGRMVDVRWCVRRYGYARIHRFLREVGHPELTPRTLRFWRLVLGADEQETWATTPSWRRTSAEPWHG